MRQNVSHYNFVDKFLFITQSQSQLMKKVDFRFFMSQSRETLRSKEWLKYVFLQFLCLLNYSIYFHKKMKKQQ